MTEKYLPTRESLGYKNLRTALLHVFKVNLDQEIIFERDFENLAAEMSDELGSFGSKGNGTNKFFDNPVDSLTIDERYKQALKNNDIAPLNALNEEYHELYSEAYSKLKGLETSEGVKIESFSNHFIDRVAGNWSATQGLPPKPTRLGVSLDDVVEALEKGKVKVKPDGSLTTLPIEQMCVLIK